MYHYRTAIAPAADAALSFQSLKSFQHRNTVLSSCGLEWHHYQFWLLDQQTCNEMMSLAGNIDWDYFCMLRLVGLGSYMHTLA